MTSLKLNSTLSNNADNQSSDTNTRTNAPTDIDGEPIKFSGNPAHALGTLEAIKLCWQRTRQFQPLLENGAVLLSNGKLAIDNLQAVSFLNGDQTDPVAYGFDQPCPDTATRIANFDADAARTARGQASW